MEDVLVVEYDVLDHVFALGTGMSDGCMVHKTLPRLANMLAPRSRARHLRPVLAVPLNKIKIKISLNK